MQILEAVHKIPVHFFKAVLEANAKEIKSIQKNSWLFVLFSRLNEGFRSTIRIVTEPGVATLHVLSTFTRNSSHSWRLFKYFLGIIVV